MQNVEKSQIKLSSFCVNKYVFLPYTFSTGDSSQELQSWKDIK